MPTITVDAVCEPGPATLEAESERTVELGNNEWIRTPDALVLFGPDQTVAVGRYGDFVAAGIWLAALDFTGDAKADAIVPATTDYVLGPALVSARDEALWTAFPIADGTTALQRHGADLVTLAAAVLVDVQVTALEPTPNGGVVVVGTHEGEPVFVGVDGEGTELWRGATRQSKYPRVEADGAIRRFDDAGAIAWEHDPRPAPADHFPLDPGLQSAWLLPDGDVLAAGIVVGEAGENALAIRLDPAGAPRWTLTRPRATVSYLTDAFDGRTLVVGTSTACSIATWIAVVDADGDLLVDARVDPSWARFVVDGAGAIFAVEPGGYGELSLRWFGEVPQ